MKMSCENRAFKKSLFGLLLRKVKYFTCWKNNGASTGVVRNAVFVLLTLLKYLRVNALCFNLSQGSKLFICNM